MLAQRFARMAEPVRYAITDPSHLHALQNWLRIQTAMRGLPRHFGGEAALDPMLAAGTPGHELLGDLLREHPDPSAIAPLHDYLEEHGVRPYAMAIHPHHMRNEPLGTLMAALNVLHPQAHGANENPEISRLLQMYSAPVLNHPSIQQMVQHQGGDRNASDLNFYLRSIHHPLTAAGEEIRSNTNPLRHPVALANMMHLAGAVMNHPYRLNYDNPEIAAERDNAGSLWGGYHFGTPLTMQNVGSRVLQRIIPRLHEMTG